jgi:hypothetical protein
VCKVISHCSFNFPFLIVSDVEHFFHYLLAICMSYEKCSPCTLSILHLVYLFSYRYWVILSSLYSLDINPLPVALFAKIFSLVSYFVYFLKKAIWWGFLKKEHTGKWILLICSICYHFTIIINAALKPVQWIFNMRGI